MRKLYQPVAVEAIDLTSDEGPIWVGRQLEQNAGWARVHNRYHFLALTHLSATWALLVDGEQRGLARDWAAVADVPARREELLALPEGFSANWLRSECTSPDTGAIFSCVIEARECCPTELQSSTATLRVRPCP